MSTKFYSPDSQVDIVGGSVHPSEPIEKEGFEILVNNKKISMPHRLANGEAILEHSGHLPLTCYTLYMKLAGCDFERVSLQQEIDLKNPGLEHFVTKDPETFPYSVNKDPELTNERELTPHAIIQQAGLDPEKVYLIELKSNGDEDVLAFKMEQPIKMNCRGIHFITKDWVENVDIEEFGKQCKEVPPAKHYLIKVDKEKFSWSEPLIAVEQLIRFVQKTNPSNFSLIKFMSNSPKPIPLPYTGIVDLREKCLIRFVVQPKTQNDGLRPGFSLPEEDKEFLDSAGYKWEAIAEQNYMWVIIHDYPVPDGYQVQTCSVALMVPPTYPASEIDMAYFHPHLKKNSGKAITALSSQPINGKSFQRWSRHRQPGQWKPGVDSIATHLILVTNWLETDLKR